MLARRLSANVADYINTGSAGNELYNDWMISFNLEDMFGNFNGNSGFVGNEKTGLSYANGSQGDVFQYTDTDSESGVHGQEHDNMNDDECTVTEGESDEEDEIPVRAPVKKYRSARLNDRASTGPVLKREDSSESDHLVPSSGTVKSPRKNKSPASSSSSQASTTPKSSSSRRRKHVGDMTPDELVRARELNKLAARRNRAARKAKWEGQIRKIKQLDSDNLKLKELIKDLHMEHQKKRMEVVRLFTQRPDLITVALSGRS